jgi:uncharacterized protein
MKRIKFGFDIDGTVTCPTSYLPYLNKSFNRNLTLDDVQEYSLHPLLNITEKEFWEWMDEHEETICKQSPVAQYFHVVFPEWSDKHEFFFVSARRKHLLEATHEWLEKHNVPYSHVELIGKHNKIEAIKKLQCDIFFEDKHDNACEISEQCGIPVILFDTPYNREPIPEGVIRVSDWMEAKKWVNCWLKEKEKETLK